jgi:hypothetical protein
MSDKEKTFHEIALQSDLFKGHTDWYFCYLKTEKIAHVLAVLCDKSAFQQELENILTHALVVPQKIAFFAAGKTEISDVLAEIFSTLTLVRVTATRGHLLKENALILIQEYERVAQKLNTIHHLPSFLSADDFTVPQLDAPSKEALLSTQIVDFSTHDRVKDVQGHAAVKDKVASKSKQEDRGAAILDFVKKNKNVSIKDISAVIRDCSEKTIQRELALLIQRGLVEKLGERRWSVYVATPQS